MRVFFTKDLPIGGATISVIAHVLMPPLLRGLLITGRLIDQVFYSNHPFHLIRQLITESKIKGK